MQIQYCVGNGVKLAPGEQWATIKVSPVLAKQIMSMRSVHGLHGSIVSRISAVKSDADMPAVKDVSAVANLLPVGRYNGASAHCLVTKHKLHPAARPILLLADRRDGTQKLVGGGAVGFKWVH